MKNINVQEIMNECAVDLNSVKFIIDGIGQTSNIVPYLTKYAIIKACGTIESCFKSIIADHCSRRSKKQIKQYITKNIRENSCNPSYSNICGMLKDFDINWKDQFKLKIRNHHNADQLTTSLQSLVDARNEFAHGGNPVASITDILTYFKDCKTVIEFLDDVIL